MCQLSLDEAYFILLSIRNRTKSIVYPPGTTALVSPGPARLKGGGRACHDKCVLTSRFQPTCPVPVRYCTTNGLGNQARTEIEKSVS
jgi:hypothetical protein